MDNHKLSQINWGLILMTLILFTIGMVNLYSASAYRNLDGVIELASFYQKQALWSVGGFILMFLSTVIDYRHFKNFAVPIFLLTIVLLLAVPIIGTTINNAKRWIDIGFFRIQPSELAKISTTILIAKVLSSSKEPLGWGGLFQVFLIISVPVVLILKQPDLGTALNIVILVGGIILYRGLKPWVFRICCLSVPLLLPLGWQFMKPYQKERVFTFLNPERAPKDEGFQIIQSKITIGSGEIWGKGFLAGTQSKLRFLPEKHTDFAIAVFSEEWGFVGTALLILFFCLFLLCIINTATDAKDRFGSTLVVGVFFYFFVQIVINIGMVTGMLPVVGMPLPFISYGGSATVVNFFLIGLVLNVSMRRFVFRLN
ncbi:rod shape-determining protein RodA [Desulfovibrio litoralis]|uniref:Peptidoglycan glycosyltransferase RodA n=1 Tax=Desulfovibrio litoralis DSM 11393 TaxID=1121455 RepID=A0A1M7S8A4_9BACT|nr:rod shape-determining protein RodA [Desulfovibrio litoralis]SHN54660.1 cell elongation-specific peptidoglycan biosynthesis regulator RodA [Desulfovibrio litoralis DSM 11393]